MVKTRTAVHEVHQLVKRVGGEVLHEPQSFRNTRPLTSRLSGWTRSA
jgi:hypothetical protein